MDPLVRAVMITGKPGREYLARIAVNAFLEQRYPNKQLFILNDGKRLLEDPPPHVIEYAAPPGLSLGALRNMAMQMTPVKVDYLMQWDDDDYSHPMRMQWQVDRTPRGTASVLRFETHIKIGGTDPRVCVPTRKPGYGFAGTLMHPAETPFRYPETAKGEDSEFVRQWRKSDQLVVLQNEDYPALYTRLAHHVNTWSTQHIMSFPRGNVPLSNAERCRVVKLAHRYALAFAESCNRAPAESSCSAPADKQ